MTPPIIADTSAWINFFNGNKGEEVAILSKYIENNEPLYLCPTILQEVLQGISSDKSYTEVKDSFLAFDILDDDPLEMSIGAADLYRKLRKKGITIRKSNDCLIAHYAIKHGLQILHKDKDFKLIMENLD